MNTPPVASTSIDRNGRTNATVGAEEVDPTKPILPSENLKLELEWTKSDFRPPALRDKTLWRYSVAFGQSIAIFFGFSAAVCAALAQTKPDNPVFGTLSIVLPAVAGAASTALLQMKAENRQRNYELAWQEYDHLLSSADWKIARAGRREAGTEEYEAKCSEITKELIDGRFAIEKRLIG